MPRAGPWLVTCVVWFAGEGSEFATACDSGALIHESAAVAAANGVAEKVEKPMARRAAALETLASRVDRDLARYRSVEIPLMGESAEGGSLVAFCDGARATKLLVTYYGETGQETLSYYLAGEHNDFVVINVEETYELPIGVDSEGNPNPELPVRVKSSQRTEFYVVAGSLARWSRDGKRAPRGATSEAKERATKLAGWLTEYLESLSRASKGPIAPCGWPGNDEKNP